MSKSSKTQTPKAAPAEETPVAQPPAAMEDAPTAMVKPPPMRPFHVAVPRQRGESPACPHCGSGMKVNGTEKIPSNHPIRDGFGKRIVRYYQCLNEACPIGRTIPYKLTAAPERRGGR